MKLTFELYEALISVGVEETLARKTASVVLGEEDKKLLATKEDIYTIIKWVVGTGIALAGIGIAMFSILLSILFRAI